MERVGQAKWMASAEGKTERPCLDFAVLCTDWSMKNVIWGIFK